MSNTRIIFGLLALLSVVLCCLSISEPITKDLKPDVKDDSDENDRVIKPEFKPKKREMTHHDYIRLPEGKCFDGSTYKCTEKPTNLGGSEWCIMLFPDAIAHCDTDPSCAGYAINTAQSFRSKYDRNGKRAVHLVKIGEKTVPCSSTEWSGYEKQKTIRTIPVEFGTSTCDERHEGDRDRDRDSCRTMRHFDYTFVSKSRTEGGETYLCKDHEKNMDKKGTCCILPFIDAVHLCDTDEKCDGFMISTDEAWNREHTHDGMHAVQLFGKGCKFTLDEKCRSFQKRT